MSEARSDTEMIQYRQINAHMASLKQAKRSHVSDKIVEKTLPVPVERALVKLGHDLALARRRRRLTQASMAERIQTSTATLRRLEHGDPQVAFGVVLRAFHVLGELDRLAQVLDSSVDEIGLTLMNEQVPQRVRTRRLTPDTGAM